MSALQELLSLDPLIYPEGLVTGYFGQLTRAAVQRFQEAMKIVQGGNESSTGYGRAGPRTLAALGSYPWVRAPSTGSIASLITQLGASNMPASSAPPTRSPASITAADAGLATAAAQGACLFNGIAVQNRGSQIFFDTPLVQAGEQCSSRALARACNNGQLSGSDTFRYTSCSAGAAPTDIANTCFVGSTVVTNGNSQAFYDSPTVPSSDSCLSHRQTRTCMRGVLSGDPAYKFTSCATVAPTRASCSLSGVAVADGLAQTFYQSSVVPFGQSCSALSESRTCINGVLQGSFTNPSCTVAAASSCVFNGSTLTDGQSVTAYQSASVPAGNQCVSQQRTCTNGTLSGSFANSACTAGSPAVCTFNGQSIASGQSVTAYQAASVPFGASCVAEQRTCSNGMLSGSFANATCSVQAAASCTLDGVTVASGSSYTFFDSANVASGDTCSAHSQTRTCTNGTLSGTAAYNRASCSVASLLPAPVNCSISWTTVVIGGSGGGGEQRYQLNWSSTNATTASISGIGAVSPSGSYVIYPPDIQATTYTMIVNGADEQTNSCQTTVPATSGGGGT